MDVNINNVYLHNFESSSSCNAQITIRTLKKLKSILKYSLVSHNYYINNISKKGYKCRFDSSVQAHNDNYISLVDIGNCFKKFDSVRRFEPIYQFMYRGAFILLKKDWIDNELKKSKFVSPFNDINAVNYEMLEYLNINQKNLNQLIQKGLRYVIPGEIKVKDKIPFEEICGIAVTKHYIKTNDEIINLINDVLIEMDLSDLPVYILDTVLKPYFDINSKFDFILKDNIKKLTLNK